MPITGHALCVIHTFSTVLTFFLGVVTGLALAWAVEWLLDWRHWARDRAALNRAADAQQAALAAAQAEIERLRAERSAQAGEQSSIAGA